MIAEIMLVNNTVLHPDRQNAGKYDGTICISVRCERCSSLRTTFGHHPVVLTGKPRAKESLCFAKLCSSTGAQASLMAYSDISACQTASLRFAILSCILHAALRCRLSVLMLMACCIACCMCLHRLST